jgi:TP901 family phage tail tape measure protein
MKQIGLDAVLNNVPDFTGGIDKMNKAVDGFAQNGKGQGDSFASGFGEIVTGALREIGELAVDALLKAGQAVAGFVKSSIDVAGNFEQEFAQFKIAVGHTIDDSGKSLQDFKDLFISLGKELPVSTQEVEQAATEMARGGIDPAVIAAGGLKQTIQFAAAALKGDLVQAAQISAKTMQAWTAITDSAATKTDFLTHAQNLMTQATTAASTTVDQLFLGLSNVGGTARLAGVSFDETVKALAQLTPSFASSADAGTSLKTFFARLQPTTQPAIDAMTQLGLYTQSAGSAFYDAQGKFIGMQAAEDLLNKSTVGLTDAQREMALQTIFGNDAIRAAGVFALQGQAGYDALSASIGKQTTLSDAAATAQATYNTSVENAKGSVEALQITVGSALLPVLTNLMNNVIAPAINTVTDFASALLGNQAAFDKLSPTMQDIASTIKTLSGDIKTIIGAFSDAGAGSDAFAKALDTLGTDLGAPPGLIKSIVSGAQDLVKWFGTANDASSTLGTAVTGLSGIWQLALKAITDVGNGYMAIAQSVLPIIQKLWTDHGAQISAFVKDAYDHIIQIITTALQLYNAIVPPILQSIAKFISDHATAIQTILSGAWNAISGITDAALTIIEGVLKIALDLISGNWTKAWKDIQDMSVRVVQDIQQAIGGFLSIIAGLFDTSLQDIVNLWQHNWDTLVQIATQTDWISVGRDVINGIIKGVEGAADSLMSTLKNLASDALQAAKDALGIGSPSKEFQAIGGFAIDGLIKGLADGWPALSDQIGAIADGLLSKMQDIGSQMQQAVADGFGATASIDRQIAKNLDRFKDILPQYAQYTTGALKEAQQQATEMIDPTEGAKFFKMRSDQILEYAKLQKDLDAAGTQQDKDRISAQMLLINKAQTAEISQFDATKQTQTAAQGIVDAINKVMMTISGINLTDSQIQVVGLLSNIWGQLQTPVTTQRTPYNPNAAGPTTNTTNFNMPIYSNNSPSAFQDSMAIAAAAMP